MTAKELRKQWIAALRSGEYKQAHFRLTDEGGYCCLGVLCEVAVKEKIITGYDKNGSLPPYEVRKSVGLSSGSGMYQDIGGINRYLTSDNDVNEFDFNKIADIIESEPKGMFRDE